MVLDFVVRLFEHICIHIFYGTHLVFYVIVKQMLLIHLHYPFQPHIDAYFSNSSSNFCTAIAREETLFFSSRDNSDTNLPLYLTIVS